MRRSGYAQHSVQKGDVIESFVDEDVMQQVLIAPKSDGTGVSAVFLIRALVGWNNSELWELVTEVTEVSKDVYRSVSLRVDDCKLLMISYSVRKVHPIHPCNLDPGCTIQVDIKHVHHGVTIEDMGAYYLIRQRDGYPPRQA